MAQLFTSFIKSDDSTTIDLDILNKYVNTDYETVVVSIIGLSRQGKSAFLNCLLHTSVMSAPMPIPGLVDLFSNGKSVRYFTSQSKKLSKSKDVTKGMYYYNLIDHEQKKTYCIIDVQGIGGTESQTDPTVLLFCYFISDIIIVNCNSLDTSTLKMLEPIATLKAKIAAIGKKHSKGKPTLIFRVLDVETDFTNEDINNSYNVMMEKRKDQADGIRQCIEELFDSEKCLFTNKPSDANLKKLDSCYISDFLKEEKSFQIACQELNVLIKKTKGFNKIKSKFIGVANKINSQQNNLQASVFDTASRVTKDDITIWIQGDMFGGTGKSQIPDELKTKIDVSNCYVNTWALIETRYKKIVECRDAYEERFKDTPPDLKESGLVKLNEIINKEYHIALTKYIELLNELFIKVLTTATKDFKYILFDEYQLDDVEKEIKDIFDMVSNIYLVVLSALYKISSRAKNLPNETMECLFELEKADFKDIKIPDMWANVIVGFKYKFYDPDIDFSQLYTVDNIEHESIKIITSEIKKHKNKINLIIKNTKAKFFKPSIKYLNKMFENDVEKLELSYEILVDKKMSEMYEKYNISFANEKFKIKDSSPVNYRVDFGKIKDNHITITNEDAPKTAEISYIVDTSFAECMRVYIGVFNSYKFTFEKYRKEKLDSILINYHKTERSYTDVKNYYDSIKQHNEVYLIPYNQNTESNNYETLVDLGVKVHLIRSKEQFEKDIPREIRKYLALIDVKSKIIKDQSIRHLYNTMFRRWLEIYVESI